MKIWNIDVKVVRGDIAHLKVDAIVNPANGQLTMEKGLAGYLKKEGGAAIEVEAMSIGPLKLGQAAATGAGHLRAKHLIHTVTTMESGITDETIVRQAAASALKSAEQIEIQTVAFPALGCGEGGFPPAGAAKIITQEIMKCARYKTSIKEVVFCLYDQETFEAFNTTVYGYLRHINETLGLGPYVTVDIIIEYRDGVVLIERSNPPYGWALPGGFVDYGESLENAAVREAKEETNLDLMDLRQFHTYSNPDRDMRFHTISTVFIAKGRGNPQFGDDAKGLKLVRYEDLPELDYAFDHKEIIKEYLMEKEFGDGHF